jgi:hypothetical protein
MGKSKRECVCTKEYEMAELDEDATEGQLADYLAAQESGDYGNWAVETEKCKCTNRKSKK